MRDGSSGGCSSELQGFAAEGEALQWRQPRQPGFLQPRVVVVVEVVVAQDFVTARQQALAEFRADAAGGAGDEDAHGGVLGWRIGGKDKRCSEVRVPIPGSRLQAAEYGRAIV